MLCTREFFNIYFNSLSSTLEAERQICTHTHTHTARFIPQCLQWLLLGQAEARSWETLLGLSHEGQVPKHFRPLCTTSQEAGSWIGSRVLRAEPALWYVMHIPAI